MKKTCSRCKRLLLFNCFNKDRYARNGFAFQCKECKKLDYQNNKKKIKEHMRQYYRDNKEKITEKHKQYYYDNREEILEYHQKRKEDRKQYYQNNKERIAKQSREYRQNNKDKRNERNKRIRKNPIFRLNHNLGKAIYKSLRIQGISKNGRIWESFVNFTLEELTAHLEGLFQDRMTWKNHGKWQIDHIKPISLFNFENVNDPEFKECWSLNNLQPLWARDNQSKGNKFKEV